MKYRTEYGLLIMPKDERPFYVELGVENEADDWVENYAAQRALTMERGGSTKDFTYEIVKREVQIGPWYYKNLALQESPTHTIQEWRKKRRMEERKNEQLIGD